MAEQPLLSIIITSYTTERLKDIYELLDSIKAQTHPNIETIFVAERSTQLVDKVKAYSSKEDSLKLEVIFNEGEPGLAAARNLGIKEAKGDIVAFVDDDVVLFPDWAEKMVKTYDDDSVIGVTGPAFPLWEDESMSWFPEEFYWIISCTSWTGWKETIEARSAWGMNMSFKHGAFDAAGHLGHKYGSHYGYSESIAEDLEFSMRAKASTGKNIIYNPNVKVWHRVYKFRLTKRFIAGRAYHIGLSRRVLKKLCGKDSNLLSIERGLLKRIIKLLINLPKEFLRDPFTAGHRFSVTFVALTFTFLGYIFPSSSLARRWFG